jgi:hypothetical protein
MTPIICLFPLVFTFAAVSLILCMVFSRFIKWMLVILGILLLGHFLVKAINQHKSQSKAVDI